MAKRILVYTLTYAPFIGGAEVALQELVRRIPAEEIDFDIVTLRFDSSLPRVEVIGNTTIYRVGFASMSPVVADLYRFPLSLNKYLFPVLGWLHGLFLHRRKKYDAVWSIMANYAGFAALFFKLGAPEVRLLLTLQEGDPPEHIRRRVGIFYPVFRLLFKKADLVHTISTFLASFAKTEGYAGTPVVVPNGVDLELFSAPQPEKTVASLRKHLHKKNTDVFLITSSRLVHKNAVDICVQAMPLLPKRVRLLVAGAGPDDWKLKLSAIEFGVQDRVVFLGHINQRELPAYLAVSDIFVRPSRSEGMGNSFIEAMAAGIPVIATPVGGIIDFLFDPKISSGHEPTGLFCDVESPESLAACVTRLTDDVALRDKLVVQAKKIVFQRYSWEHIVSRMRQEIFIPLLDGQKK